VTKEAAERSVQMLKNKMSGVAIQAAPKKWSNDVINDNNHLLNLGDSKLIESGTLH
jgi:D-proline reductase (dithiol) PrdA